jgi:hypothetical protein
MQERHKSCLGILLKLNPSLEGCAKKSYCTPPLWTIYGDLELRDSQIDDIEQPFSLAF